MPTVSNVRPMLINKSSPIQTIRKSSKLKMTVSFSSRLCRSPNGFFPTVHFLLLISTFVVGFFPGSVLCGRISSTGDGKCSRPPAIFNFGDSNSDTGGLVAGLGFGLALPNGRTFFREPAGRFSDGRLIIDFLCESVNTEFVNPYLDSTASSFSNGINFAIAGSSLLPKNVPFSLNIQLNQFLRFKARSTLLSTPPLGSRSGNSLHFVGDEGFRNGVYMIDMGQNDLSNSFAKNFSLHQVVNRIPSIISEIKYAVQAIYAEGGRKFWVHNTGPLGCLPRILSLARKNSGDLDQFGCLSGHNAAARSFNEALFHLCQELRAEMHDAVVVYVDIYSIKYDLIANSAQYGFTNPLMACCGFGGHPYNCNSKVICGGPGYQVCSDGSKYVSWDGIHYTEAANKIIATKLLSTAYSTPNVSFNYFCN